MNAKGDLIARALSLGLGAPEFEVSSDGPPHQRTFHVTVRIGGEALGEGGSGRSRKDAERAAADSALRVLDGEPMADTEEVLDEAPTGRWPIYAGVLEAALETATEFADEDASLDDVRRDAGRLYRELLLDLGHGPDPL